MRLTELVAGTAVIGVVAVSAGLYIHPTVSAIRETVKDAQEQRLNGLDTTVGPESTVDVVVGEDEHSPGVTFEFPAHLANTLIYLYEDGSYAVNQPAGADPWNGCHPKGSCK